ncbi:hypothetical protein ABZ756_13790 [Mammaliicoccus sciuri]|uniref:Phage protein n=1 Tax=Sporosarcina newyorkensis TaxID=759851 RepID=A0A1T4YTB0_9BACL|nr:hypothetical protein [Sporosarcina newyorkensis]SKB05107.1 hypothetical protein SAMN04244570_3557 [Sporosarcina newyorkensis]
MEQKTITINEKEFTLQKVFPVEWLKIRDRCKNKFGVPSEEKTYKEVLAHIVVSPKMKIEDFDDWGELDELVKEAVNFQQGGDEE